MKLRPSQCSHIYSTKRMGGRESVVPCKIEVENTKLENLKTRGSIRVKMVRLGGVGEILNGHLSKY